MHPQQNYEQKRLNLSLKYYNKIVNKSDKIYYNIANILYKQKNYTKAIMEYDKIKSKQLEYKKLHNLGNCYAQLNQIDKSIQYYKEALKIKNDQDTNSNLQMLKRLKNTHEAEELDDKEWGKEFESEKKLRDGQNKINKYKNSDKSNNSNSTTKETTEVITSNNISNLKTLSKQKINQEFLNIENKKKKKYVTNDATISDLEERKWNLKLNDRRLKTLLIPINQTKEIYEQNIKSW